MAFPSYPLISHLVHSCGGVAEAQELIDAINAGGGGGGTVTTVSIVSANGFSGSVANPTTTPAITISQSDGSITYAKLQNSSAGQVLLGNPTGSAGPFQEVTLGSGLTFSGSSLVANGSASQAQIVAHIWGEF